MTYTSLMYSGQLLFSLKFNPEKTIETTIVLNKVTIHPNFLIILSFTHLCVILSLYAITTIENIVHFSKYFLEFNRRKSYRFRITWMGINDDRILTGHSVVLTHLIIYNYIFVNILNEFLFLVHLCFILSLCFCNFVMCFCPLICFYLFKYLINLLLFSV